MLAKEGVPAVLAMQGKLSMSAATQFIPEFFRQLAEHGEVDRATASARAKSWTRRTGGSPSFLPG